MKSAENVEYKIALVRAPGRLVPADCHRPSTHAEYRLSAPPARIHYEFRTDSIGGLGRAQLPNLRPLERGRGNNAGTRSMLDRLRTRLSMRIQDSVWFALLL